MFSDSKFSFNMSHFAVHDKTSKLDSVIPKYV